MSLEQAMAFAKSQVDRQYLICPYCDRKEHDWYECLSTPTHLNDEFTEWQEVECRCEKTYKARVRQLMDFEVKK